MQPDELILHVGRKDLQDNTSRQVIDNIFNLADNISQNCTSEVTISLLLKCLDKPNLESKLTEINNSLHEQFQFRSQQRLEVYFAQH